MDGRFGRRYDWAEIQRHYDAGHSARACRDVFGCSAWAWNQAVRRGALALRPKSQPIETFLVDGKRTDRGHLKRRLLAAGIKQGRCEACGITDWFGQPLALELHHVNGDGLDNRIENLQLLCPNCHSLTDTWGGRNARRKAA
jgi:5-methylcytosine-specific restriction endonuclease McrA